MATSNTTIDFTSTSDATFRAWGLAVSTALQAIGLVLTADTGQVNWATVTKPTLTNTVGGYEIYKLNDSLQATKPVFFRVEYGTAASASQASIWIQMGTGTNGAGTLTGVTGNRIRSDPSNSATTAAGANLPSFFSGNGTYFVIHIRSNSSNTWAFYVFDRTRNSDGTLNSDGCVFIQTIGSNSSIYYGVIDFTLSVARENTTMSTLPNIATPPDTPFTSGNYGTDTYLFPVNVFLPKNEAPMLCVLSYFAADITLLTTFTATHLGASHTFMALGTGLAWFGQVSGSSACIIWE